LIWGAFSDKVFIDEGKIMGSKKNNLKIDAALEARKAAHKGPGGKVPGSRNKKKTGYQKVSAIKK
jgi:hypothetical protein